MRKWRLTVLKTKERIPRRDPSVHPYEWGVSRIRSAGGLFFPFEWIGRQRDGTPFWVELPLRKTMLGGMGRVRARVQRIDKQKRSERALREREERSRPLLERASDGTTLLWAGIIRYANLRPAKTLGCPVEEQGSVSPSSTAASRGWAAGSAEGPSRGGEAGAGWSFPPQGLRTLPGHGRWRVPGRPIDPEARRVPETAEEAGEGGGVA